MNNKMAINIYLSTIKTKKTKQTRTDRMNHGHVECCYGCHMGGGYGRKGEEVRGLRNQ